VGIAVGGVMASHSTLMNTHFDEVANQDAAVGYRTALQECRRHLERLEADAVVVIGSNHFRGFFLDLLPAFSIGVGEVIGAGEAGTPAGPLPTNTGLARHILETEASAGVELAFSMRMTIDHGITHAVQHIVPSGVPIIPIVINVFAPPLPSVRRSAELGRVLGDAIASWPGNGRVAVIGSGGLSHNLPWPDWRDPKTEEDRFLVEAWLNGRDDWRTYEVKKRSIIRSATASISPAFDRDFLTCVVKEDGLLMANKFADLDARAGNGGAELRNWIATKSALPGSQVEVLGYWPIDEWLTGMGAATLTSETVARQRESWGAPISDAAALLARNGGTL
jgi:2,3-dihydroxyphenylpropionate 1,2-dioxygenase